MAEGMSQPDPRRSQRMAEAGEESGRLREISGLGEGGAGMMDAVILVVAFLSGGFFGVLIMCLIASGKDN